MQFLELLRPEALQAIEDVQGRELVDRDADRLLDGRVDRRARALLAHTRLRLARSRGFLRLRATGGDRRTIALAGAGSRFTLILDMGEIQT